MSVSVTAYCPSPAPVLVPRVEAVEFSGSATFSTASQDYTLFVVDRFFFLHCFRKWIHPCFITSTFDGSFVVVVFSMHFVTIMLSVYFFAYKCQ